jgi:hypothetical protein
MTMPTARGSVDSGVAGVGLIVVGVGVGLIVVGVGVGADPETLNAAPLYWQYAFSFAKRVVSRTHALFTSMQQKSPLSLPRVPAME